MAGQGRELRSSAALTILYGFSFLVIIIIILRGLQLLSIVLWSTIENVSEIYDHCWWWRQNQNQWWKNNCRLSQRLWSRMIYWWWSLKMTALPWWLFPRPRECSRSRRMLIMMVMTRSWWSQGRPSLWPWPWPRRRGRLWTSISSRWLQIISRISSPFPTTWCRATRTFPGAPALWKEGGCLKIYFLTRTSSNLL